MTEKELTVERINERLRTVKELSAKLPPEFQTFHRELADLYEQLRRAESGILVAALPPRVSQLGEGLHGRSKK